MYVLSSIEESRLLGQKISFCLQNHGLRHIFLKGDLGAGKTTLTRFLVQPLEGSETCEIASPTFSLINYYPVTPPVQHCDLYRCRGEIPEEILDNLENPNMVTVLEWSQFLPEEFWPDNVLEIALSRLGQRRSVSLHAYGEKAAAVLRFLEETVLVHLPRL